MVALAEVVPPGRAQSKAALTEDDTGTGGLGRTRPLTVRQLGEMRRIAIWDELRERSDRQKGKEWMRDQINHFMYLLNYPAIRDTFMHSIYS